MIKFRLIHLSIHLLIYLHTQQCTHLSVCFPVDLSIYPLTQLVLTGLQVIPSMARPWGYSGKRDHDSFLDNLVSSLGALRPDFLSEFDTHVSDCFLDCSE